MTIKIATAFEDLDIHLVRIAMQPYSQCGRTLFCCGACRAEQERQRIAAFRGKLQAAQLGVVGLMQPAQHGAAGA